MPNATLDLTGNWQFREYPLAARRMRDLDEGTWLPATVPGSIFTDLIGAGQAAAAAIFAEPENFAHLSEKPWVYRKTFDVPDEVLNCDRIDLVFDGLDTVANVWLNEKLIARTDNMFIPYRFDVTSLLKPAGNSLLVKFAPALEYAARLMDRYGRLGCCETSDPRRTYIRKAQYQFGSDFCPPLPGCGIWQPVRLEAFKKAIISDVHIRTIDCSSTCADIRLALTLDTLAHDNFLCRLTLSAKSHSTEYELPFEPGQTTQTTLLRVENPALWWPAGMGEQNLYRLEAVLLHNNTHIDRFEKHYGIRTIKLNRAAEDGDQKSRLEVNCCPVSVRGASWLPASMFPGSLRYDDYHRLLDAAADANINMLRVWAGGLYESDHFYELCDRLGILVWQDFMFADAYYPERKWFLDHVAQEASAVIKRLRSHPCLALWCGNSRIDSLHADCKLGTGKKFHGRAIFHQLLPSLVADLSPDIHYVPTMPLVQKDNLALTAQHCDLRTGYLPLRHYQPPASNPAFVTEFGLQSIPDLETISQTCPTENMRIGSLALERNNYQPDGNSFLYCGIGGLFGAPQNLRQFVYFSQLAQARAAKLCAEHLRCRKDLNSGSLFWHLNDPLPAITCSAIDSACRPKALYYYAKRFYSPCIVTVLPRIDSHHRPMYSRMQPVGIAVINDSNQPLVSVLNCRLIDLAGRTIDSVTVPLAVSPFGIASVPKLPKAVTWPDNPQACCLYVTIEKNDAVVAENLFFYLPDKYIDWPTANITAHLSRIDPQHLRLTLQSNAVARDLFIDVPSAVRLSDNFLNLIPGRSYHLVLQTADTCVPGPAAIKFLSVNPNAATVTTSDNQAASASQAFPASQEIPASQASGQA